MTTEFKKEVTSGLVIGCEGSYDYSDRGAAYIEVQGSKITLCRSDLETLVKAIEVVKNILELG